MRFCVNLIKYLATFGTGHRNSCLEELDDNVDDLAEPVDVENVERRAREHADELVFEIDELPSGRVESGVEYEPVGHDGENAHEKEDDYEQDTVDEVDARLFLVECEKKPAKVEKRRGCFACQPKQCQIRKHTSSLEKKIQKNLKKIKQNIVKNKRKILPSMRRKR